MGDLGSYEGWEYEKIDDIWIHESFKDHKLGVGDDLHGDVTGKMTYDPSKSRLFNSFEVAQVTRFQIAVNWMRMHFQDLQKTERKKRSKIVIDLGCSRSYLYGTWKNRGNYFGWPLLEYMGIDSNLKRIEDGRDMFPPKKNDRVVYGLADLGSEISLPKSDIIVCMELLEHLPREKAIYLIYTIRKSLKSSGIAIISSPNPSPGEWVWGEESKVSHQYEYPWEEACFLFEKSGFKILDRVQVLPDRNYRRDTSFPKLRNRLSKILPPPIINSVLLLAEKNMTLGKQWICKISKNS